jgi:flagellum-specific ATP synthase
MVALLWSQPFFATHMRSIDRNRDDKFPTAGVSVKNGSPTLVYNGTWLSTLPDRQILGLLKHEAYHLVYSHVVDRRKTPHRTWNYATDLAINGLLSVGRGQRIGLIAGSGVGKSVLLSMLCRGTQADVVVAALIGERAREVSGFVQSVLTEESRARTVVVAVTAEQSPILRIRGAHRASAIADYFRSQGKQVLLIVDSLTRVGHAQREIGLALGEQPTAKGYPPSVVSLIPRLVERAGRDRESGGSITAFYTVLADGDDVNDPVVDAARAITDGHIVLSRSLAEQGVYPAIDVAASVSRVSTHICSKSHLDAARVFRRRYSLYQENKDLALMGGYQAGIDREIDLALSRHPQMMNFITQPVDQRCSWEEAQSALTKVVSDA